MSSLDDFLAEGAEVLTGREATEKEKWPPSSRYPLDKVASRISRATLAKSAAAFLLKSVTVCSPG